MALVIMAAVAVAALPAAAEIRRYGIFIGNNLGYKDEARLRFAERDADKIRSVFQELGGFPSQNIVMVKGQSAARARRALVAVNARIRRLTGTPSMLLVYYSGHADARSLHLGSSDFDLSEIKKLVEGSPATFRFLILDACRSGALTRAKGVRRGPPLRITLGQRLAAEGVVFLTATSADENAHESNRVRGSYFTHFLVSGLMGAADANGDDVVVLDEIYRFAYQNTLRATSRAFAGLQHPAYRYDMSGSGRVVLTRVLEGRGNRGLLRVPRNRTYLIMRDNEMGEVVAEICLRDRNRRISLKEGRYYVRGQGRDDLLEGTVTVRRGKIVALKERGLRRVAYARLVRKGTGEARLSHAARVSYRLRTALDNSSALCHGAVAGYRLDSRFFALGVEAGYCRSSFSNQYLRSTLEEWDMVLRASHARDLWRLTFELGVGVGAALFHQSFDTRGVAPSRWASALEIGAFVGLSLQLGGGFAVVGVVDGQTYVYRLHPTADEEGGVTANFALRTSVGLERQF